MPDLKQHPLSAAFPAMSDTDFAELRADVAANGLHTSITLYDEQVLDGWHRYCACQQTGTEPHFEIFNGGAVAAKKFVASQNLKRRHLSSAERALIAARFTMWDEKQTTNVAEDGTPASPTLQRTVDEAAELANVGATAVKEARAILKGATPEIVAKVESGEMSVKKAAKQVRASKPKPAPAPTPKAKKADPEFEIAPRTLAAWNALTEPQRAKHLARRNPKASLNQQNKGEDDNAIDWAKWTWNPVTGCLHNCPYCYARDIAERFAGTAAFPQGFTPMIHPDRLSAPLNRIPMLDGDPRERRIFVCSMADLFGRWVPAPWIEKVLGVCREAPAWEFLMLTKFPKRMSEFDIPENVWMGTSVDCQARVDAAEAAFAKVRARVRWLSCEPLIENLKFKHLDRFNLLVIGGASPSSQTPRWIPPYGWLDQLMRQANAAGCNVFLKSNLYLKEAPGAPGYVFRDQAPDVFHYLARASTPDEQANAA